MVITVIGLSALLLARIERRGTEGMADFARARLHARSAIEMGFFRIGNDSNWRTTPGNGVWDSNQSIGSGHYSLTGVDPLDADLGDDVMDPVVLTGTGMEGEARFKLEVTLNAKALPLSCLEVALHADGDLVFSTTTLNGDQIISANGSVSASGSTINSDVEAVESVIGSNYDGTITTGIAPRDMPNPGTVFDYYTANGTSINIALLAHNSHYDLENVVLSATSNPFGVPDPAGIYIIDCLSGELRIRNCRIVATLVLLNPAETSKVHLSVNWKPPAPNFPALLVRGTMNLALDSAPLSESDLGVNFNPAGTPYDGAENAGIADTYPSMINGLVYASGDIFLTNSVTVDGVVVVDGTVSGSGIFSFSYQNAAYNDPPPGFVDTVRMDVVPGSWQQIVE